MNTKRTALWAVTGVIGLSAIGGFAWADTQRPTESPTPAVSAPTVTGPTATSGASAKASSASFMDRMNDRWDRRNEG